MNPLELEWGTATPEFLASDSLTAIHVITHAIEDRDRLIRNLVFLRGRVAFFARHLPVEMSQHVIFDDRGQDIPADIRETLRSSMALVATFEYASERE